MDAASLSDISSRSSHGTQDQLEASSEASPSGSLNRSQFSVGQGFMESQLRNDPIKNAAGNLSYGIAQYSIHNFGAAKVILVDCAKRYKILYGPHSADALHAESHFVLGKVLMELDGPRQIKMQNLSFSETNFKEAREIFNRFVVMQIENMDTVPEGLRDDAQDSLLLTNLKIQEIGVLLRLIQRRFGRLLNSTTYNG